VLFERYMASSWHQNRGDDVIITAQYITQDKTNVTMLTITHGEKMSI